MADCLIITSLAKEFAEEVERLSADPIEIGVCRSAAEARERYAGETVLFGNPQMIAEGLSAMPAVRWVQSSWAGVTPLIDHPRRDYVLTGVRNVFGPQVAEYVLGYLLAHELKIVERRERQNAREWHPAFSGSLAGKRLGVMGTGSIGAAIARAARALGLAVTGLSRSGKAVEPFEEVFGTRELGTFLPPLDYLAATLPDTPETRHLLNAETLAMLKPGAFFVNVGRSSVVDSGALVAALESRRLAGAALDVFDTEPLPTTSSLWKTRGLYITPHIAAVSHPLLIVPIFLENYRRFRAGTELRDVIDFARGY